MRVVTVEISGSMAELVDAPDLKSVVLYERVGSSPTTPTWDRSSAVEHPAFNRLVLGSNPSGPIPDRGIYVSKVRYSIQ